MPRFEPKKQFRTLYAASAKEPATVDVPAMNFLMIDGAGDPNTAPAFQAAVQALYGASYTLKFALKKAGTGPEFTVAPLEGLWWMDDMSQFCARRKDDWKWTLMIMQPPHVTDQMMRDAISQLQAKSPLEAASSLRFESFHEGPSAQILHVGPYAEEAATIQKLHDYIRQAGKQLTGKHHEVYMSDPRRVAPEKLKTILRQPMR